MKTEVNTFLNSDWHTSTCEECRSSLECSVACRPSEAPGETLVLCTDVSGQIKDRSRMHELEARCEAVLASTPTGIVPADAHRSD